MRSRGFQPEGESQAQFVPLRQALLNGAAFLNRAGVETARLDAEVLLGWCLGGGRERLYLNYESPLGGKTGELYEEALARRARREPLAYIVGRREFWSLNFIVSHNVLVPRPETELLVELAIQMAQQLSKKDSIKIIDLGTGSGVIAVSLAKEIGHSEVWATDLSPEALGVARANAQHNGVEDKIHFLQGDLFDPVKNRSSFFDMVVSNPPYVRRGEIEDLPPEARDWEPRIALDGGVDGLDLYRRIIQEAPIYLGGGGFIGLEIGADMPQPISKLFESRDCYQRMSLHQDLSGRDRAVTARRVLSRLNH
ncbi:MAG: peptide chain release factor N(5)-glutamine methyltransferase [Deltaproteobacteria bacterium]|nr:peptide chain release factor N(5)-glutamine methyltransferase [Deltaproteobacteria bacterium]